MNVSTVSWIHVTDKMMKKVGFTQNSSLYKNIKKNFIKTQDYTLKIIKYRHSIVFCKYRLDMTQTAYSYDLHISFELQKNARVLVSYIFFIIRCFSITDQTFTKSAIRATRWDVRVMGVRCYSKTRSFCTREKFRVCVTSE